MKPFKIYTDASSMQLGAVITQDNRPIAFFSRKLSKMQQKYSVTEIELLAIVETIKEFKGILWGQDIIVDTDHKNLTRHALSLTSDQVYHWQLLLEEYAPKIIYPLVWATKLLLAAIGLVFPVLVLGYKSFNCSMYHVPVPTLIEKFV